MSSPAGPEQPRACRNGPRRPRAAKASRDGPCKAIERCDGRKRVERAIVRATPVFLVILEHIDQRITNLPWAFEVSTVPAVCPEAAAATEHAIHTSRNSHQQTAKPGRQRTAVFRLDDQMHVIVLQRIVHDAKPIPIAVAQRAEQCVGNSLSA